MLDQAFPLLPLQLFLITAVTVITVITAGVIDNTSTRNIVSIHAISITSSVGRLICFTALTITNGKTGGSRRDGRAQARLR